MKRYDLYQNATNWWYIVLGSDHLYVELLYSDGRRSWKKCMLTSDSIEAFFTFISSAKSDKCL